jgi:hypothetical protein
MYGTRIEWDPDKKTLAGFSEVAMFALGMVAGPLLYLRGHAELAIAFWLGAVAIRLVGLARPVWLRPIFVGLTLLTFPIGWVVSSLAVVLVYLLVFVPIACIFRLIGRDALKIRLEPKASTYWEAYHPNQGLGRYLRSY